MAVDLLGHDFNPLFMLLNTKEWKAVISHVACDPHSADNAVKSKGFYDKKLSTRVNALHIACNNQAPVPVVQALLKTNGNLASEKESSYERLPLHIATLTQSNPRVVGALVSACPKAVKVQDIHGRLPIHYASKDRKNGERVLRYLLKIYPESVNVADDNGFLPLHVACRSGMPMAVINMLLRLAPETVLVKTNNGATPVHCAGSVKGKGKVQERIVDTLTHFAEETAKLVERDGHCSTAMTPGTASIASSVSSVSSFRCDYAGVVHASTYKRRVPEMINLSNHSSTISESDDSCSTSND
jgi:hypothetical protein